MTRFLRISDEVRDALAARRPVVALETAAVTHGLPREPFARLPASITDPALPAEVRACFGSSTPALAAAARAHAQDMVSAGFFSHTGSNGSTVGTRLRAAGCDWSGAAENIAQGQTSPEEAMTTWINSAGHRANLLGNYTELGTARIGATWVMVFAAGC